MKKIYVCPQTEIVTIETTQMIALSGTLDATQTIESSDDFASRSFFFDDFDIWDDQDEY